MNSKPTSRELDLVRQGRKLSHLPWGADIHRRTLRIDEGLLTFHLRREHGYHFVTATYEPTGVTVQLAAAYRTKAHAKRAAVAMLYAMTAVNVSAGLP